MSPEILIRRYDKLFSLYDTNNNGYVEEADIKRLYGQTLAMFGESPTSERGANIAKLWGDFWRGLLATVDPPADDRISLQQWREAMARLAGDEAIYDRVVIPIGTAVFRLVDADGDNKVGPAEWRSFQEGIGNADAADTSFQRMDTNNNGYLTVDELIDAVRDHFANPDPDTRGGWMFGEV